MKLLKNMQLLLLLILLTANCLAQSTLQFTNIGDFTTTEAKVIKDCKIGYRTIGELNEDKSNAVLWPTWFTIHRYNLIDLKVSRLLDSCFVAKNNLDFTVPSGQLITSAIAFIDKPCSWRSINVVLYF